MTEDLTAGIGDALSTDYFFLRDQLTDDQLGYLSRAREFVDDTVLPTINDYWERAQFPWPLIAKLGAERPRRRRHRRVRLPADGPARPPG